MAEIVFIVEEAETGGLAARGVGTAVFTAAGTMDGLREAVRDAVRCHFDDGEAPEVIRLRVITDEVLTA